MKMLKRTIVGIMRKPLQVLVMFLIVFVLGNVLFAAVAVKQSSSNVKSEMTARMPSYLLLRQDTTAEAGTDTLKLQALIEELKDKEEVLDVNSLVSMSVYHARNDSEVHWVEIEQLSAVENVEASFYDYEFAEGRYYTQDELDRGDNKIILLDWQAYDEKGNKLHVGDIYKIKLLDYEIADDTAEIILKTSLMEYEFEIIGLAQTVEIKDEYVLDGDAGYVFSKVIPRKCLEEIKQLQSEILAAHPEDERKAYAESFYSQYFTSDLETKFVFISARGVEANGKLEEAIRSSENFPGFHYTMVTSIDDYRYIQAPLENLVALSDVALGASAVLTILLLSLVAVLFLRNRVYEIGILMAMGERKRNILGQFVLEIVLVGLLATSFSLVSGNYLGKKISNEFMRIQIDADAETEYQQTHPNHLTQLDLLDAYKVEMSAEYVAVILALSTGVLILSSAAPVLYILRIKPKKVLM